MAILKIAFKLFNIRRFRSLWSIFGAVGGGADRSSDTDGSGGTFAATGLHELAGFGTDSFGLNDWFVWIVVGLSWLSRCSLDDKLSYNGIFW